MGDEKDPNCADCFHGTSACRDHRGYIKDYIPAGKSRADVAAEAARRERASIIAYLRSRAEAYDAESYREGSDTKSAARCASALYQSVADVNAGVHVPDDGGAEAEPFKLRGLGDDEGAAPDPNADPDCAACGHAQSDHRPGGCGASTPSRGGSEKCSCQRFAKGASGAEEG